MAASTPGRLEVRGRWYGVRGRRFVRPTLLLTRASDGTEVRVLAELDQKPWEARDGEPWVAEFATDVQPDEASAIELSVAPDITVPLTGARAAPTITVPVTGARAAPTRAGSRRARPSESDRARQELERTRARAAAAAETLEQERKRRQALEEALESERAESRRVRIELGRLRAELELAQAGRAESVESAAELDRVQRELYAARQQLERTTRERDVAAQAHAETKTALHEQTGALESAREALDRERSEARRPQEHRPQEHRPQEHRPHESAPPGPRGRPATASLYHRAAWGGRMLAVLVLAAVVIVIVLLIQGTIGR